MIRLAKASPDMNICRQLLPKIQCPSLIIHGDKDAMVSAEHPDMLHRKISGSKYDFIKY
jgi:valacyclovir hydrolase